VAETKAKYKATLDEHLFETGTLEIARIARDWGLTGPNKGMQDLLKERDEEIMAAFDALPGLPDDAWQSQMDAIMAKYTPKFRDEALRYMQEGDTTQAPVIVKEESSSSNTTLIIVIASCGGLVAIMLIAIIVTLCMRAKSRRMQGGQRPRDGDSNVVMGRPVAPGTQQAVSEGAPVEIGDKGDDNAKASGIEVS
jgi:hypothetical protein